MGLHVIVRVVEGRTERYPGVFTDTEFAALPLIGRYGITQGTGLRVIHFDEGENSRRTAYVDALPVAKGNLRLALKAAEKFERDRRRSMRYGIQDFEGMIVATAPTKTEIYRELITSVQEWRHALRSNRAPQVRPGYYIFKKNNRFADDRRVIRLY